MTPELKSYPFHLVPGEIAKKFPVRGNFIYIDTSDARFELSMDGSNYIPVQEGRQIHLADELAEIYLRATAIPATGLFVVGRGNGINHARFGDNTGAVIAAIVEDIQADTETIRGNTAQLPTILGDILATLTLGITEILAALQDIKVTLGNITVGVTSLTPYPTYESLRDAVTAGTPSATISDVILAANPAPMRETWQLLFAKKPGPYTPGDITRAEDGVIVPADYDATNNNRLWYRTL